MAGNASGNLGSKALMSVLFSPYLPPEQWTHIRSLQPLDLPNVSKKSKNHALVLEMRGFRCFLELCRRI